MKYERWYDKNSYLKDVFSFIEMSDTSVQEKIAEEIIQILINDFNLDLDKEINNISRSYTYKCSRWYDNNINLFSSFEIIKNLPDKKKNEVVKKIIETIFFVFLEEANE